MSLDCIVAASLTSHGYGQVRIKGQNLAAHRLVYEIVHGPIPEGLMVRHKCDNRACVNPAHLELGTHAENMNDRNTRGRTAMGERHGNAKLTEEDVRRIKLALAEGEKGAAIARAFGVSDGLVSCIKRGRMWKHVCL